MSALFASTELLLLNHLPPLTLHNGKLTVADVVARWMPSTLMLLFPLGAANPRRGHQFMSWPTHPGIFHHEAP